MQFWSPRFAPAFGLAALTALPVALIAPWVPEYVPVHSGGRDVIVLRGDTRIRLRDDVRIRLRDEDLRYRIRDRVRERIRHRNGGSRELTL